MEEKTQNYKPNLTYILIHSLQQESAPNHVTHYDYDKHAVCYEKS